MKKGLLCASGVFGILAVILYFSSLNHLDEKEAKLVGTSTLVNIQGTVFCAACAVICAICLVGALILIYLDDNTSGNTSFSRTSARYGFHGTKTTDGGILTAGSSWTCPKCKSSNPLSKVVCKECGTVRE